MRNQAGTLLAPGVLLAALSAAWAGPPGAVVAELFESQGCSSCPPAERVMKNLRQEFGPAVILLTYHVDYWDSMGWKDPFSDASFTERQKTYARNFAQDSMYTPECVIQGEVGFNGSDLRQARAEIASRLRSTRPEFALQAARKGPDALAVSIQAPAALESQAREWTLVIYESAAPVHVLRGENQGAIMSGDFAVRRLVAMPKTRDGRSTLEVAMDPSWNLGALGIAVLAQGDSRQIVAAQAAPVRPN